MTSLKTNTINMLII